MKTLVELKSLLSHRHVLVDSNFLLEANKSPEDFKEIFDIFISADCIPMLTRFTEFEFLRCSYQQEVIVRQREFLKAWGFLTHPLAMQPDRLSEEALEIANYYQARGIKTPSLTDCFLAALLRQKKDLFLITRNHKDFPLELFHRLYVWNVDRERDVLAFGLYQARAVNLR